MTTKRCAVLCLSLIFASVFAGQQSSEGRPQYLKSFSGKYPGLKEAVGTTKCAVCHCGKSKKVLNNYGTALKTTFKGAKNVKDPRQIDGGLTETEKEPSHVPDQTFGDLIKAGKLPGGPCPEETDADSNDACESCR